MPAYIFRHEHNVISLLSNNALVFIMWQASVSLTWREVFEAMGTDVLSLFCCFWQVLKRESLRPSSWGSKCCPVNQCCPIDTERECCMCNSNCTISHSRRQKGTGEINFNIFKFSISHIKTNQLKVYSV